MHSDKNKLEAHPIIQDFEADIKLHLARCTHLTCCDHKKLDVHLSAFCAARAILKCSDSNHSFGLSNSFGT